MVFLGGMGSQGKMGNKDLPDPLDLLAPLAHAVGGALYTRWGKSSCPLVEGTELVYSGITGGTWYNEKGGGANYLCMPKVQDNPEYYGNPEYSTSLTYRGGVNGHAYIHGVEYRQGNTNGVTFHHVEATCSTGLPCPPYDQNKELNCVVCTK